MPMRAVTVAAFAKALVILAIGVGALRIALGVKSWLLDFASWLRLVRAFASEKGATAGSVQLQVALHFAGLRGAQNIADCLEREQ
eukprot:2098694-Pleurochrysis_carterae.AAC.2